MDRDETIKLIVKALLEVVQTGAGNIEVAVMVPNEPLTMLSKEEIEAVSNVVRAEKEKEKEAASKRTGVLGQTVAAT